VAAVPFQSDSQLVDACLARLRVDACLDDDPILPTIDLLPEDVELIEDDVEEFIEVDVSELVLDCPSVKAIPSAASIVRNVVRANQRSQKEVPTLRKHRPEARLSRWPVIACALVATYCGATAFLKSPLGAKPEVQHVVKMSKSMVRL
jgi:hypothetical protein